MVLPPLGPASFEKKEVFVSECREFIGDDDAVIALSASTVEHDLRGFSQLLLYSRIVGLKGALSQANRSGDVSLDEGFLSSRISENHTRLGLPLDGFSKRNRSDSVRNGRRCTRRFRFIGEAAFRLVEARQGYTIHSFGVLYRKGQSKLQNGEEG